MSSPPVYNDPEKDPQPRLSATFKDHRRGSQFDTANEVIVDQDVNQLKRGLHGRHMQMIAIGGAIGAGLFVGEQLYSWDAMELSLTTFRIRRRLVQRRSGKLATLFHDYWCYDDAHDASARRTGCHVPGERRLLPVHCALR